MKEWLQQGRVAIGLAAVSVAFAADGVPDGAGGLAEREAQQPPTVTTEIRRVVTQRAREEAFDWLDAAIGGAAVLGLVLVAAGTSSVVLRRAQQRVLADIQHTRKEQEQ
jgi:hypothetical protein